MREKRAERQGTGRRSKLLGVCEEGHTEYVQKPKGSAEELVSRGWQV